MNPEFRENIRRYQQVLQAEEAPDPGMIAQHVEKYQTIDRLLPRGNSMISVFNFAAMRYEYVGKSFADITGHQPIDIQNAGFDSLMTLIHEDDLSLIFDKVVPDLFSKISELPNEQLQNMNFSLTCRIQIASGGYRKIFSQYHALDFTKSRQLSLVFGKSILMNDNEDRGVNAELQTIDEDLLVNHFQKRYFHESDDLNVLTATEREILVELAKGFTSQQIADRLCRSKYTIDTHRKNIMNKLGCASIVEATNLAVKQGLV